MPQRRAGRTGEYQGVILGLDEARQVPVQVGDQQVGEGHKPLPSIGLRRPVVITAAGQLGQGLLDLHRSRVEIDIGPAQRRQLSPSQAAEGSQQHQDAVALIDRLRERVDLGDGEDRSLGRLLLPATSDPARILRISPSSTAVFMIALSRRYALATVTARYLRREASCASGAHAPR